MKIKRTFKTHNQNKKQKRNNGRDSKTNEGKCLFFTVQSREANGKHRGDKSELLKREKIGVEQTEKGKKGKNTAGKERKNKHNALNERHEQ